MVFVVLVFFLGNIRSAVIAAVNIPLALLGAFTLMRLTDTPANLISLGAIDFGIIIDSTVIVVENINRHLIADTAAPSDLREAFYVPVACLGGILALLVTGTPFSVSAAVGFVSIFGIAVMDGILLSTYIRQLWDQGHPFAESIIMGSDRRLRATMMTDLVDAVGFLPAALSTRIGAQTQRPLAAVVIGGALAIALELVCFSRPSSIFVIGGCD